jgi:hypothetical protein
VLLGEKDVAQHDAGDLAPAVALGQEGKPPLIERHPPAELLEEGRQVRLGPGLRRCSVGFELRLEGCAQLVQGRQVVGSQSGSGGPLKRA